MLYLLDKHFILFNKSVFNSLSKTDFDIFNNPLFMLYSVIISLNSYILLNNSFESFLSSLLINILSFVGIFEIILKIEKSLSIFSSFHLSSTTMIFSFFFIAKL
jgi:hypothetical protein